MKGFRAMGVFGGALTLLQVGAAISGASEGLLRITEVLPPTEEVEVTYTGDTTFTNSTALPFCYRFNYSTSIPAGTVFEPGESKVFVLTGLDSSDSDVWLYKDNNFGSASSIITGMKYGPQANIGRTGVAVSAGIWPSTSDFVPAPADTDLSLQPFTLDDVPTTQWFAGVPNLGSFEEAGARVQSVGIKNDSATLTIQSPFVSSAHSLQSTIDLTDEWYTASGIRNDIEPGIFEYTISPIGSDAVQFHRVVPTP